MNNENINNDSQLVLKVQKFESRTRVYKGVLFLLAFFALFVQLPFLSRQPWAIEWSLSSLIRSLEVGYFFDNPSGYLFQITSDAGWSADVGYLMVYLVIIFIFSIIFIGLLTFFMQIFLFGLQPEKYKSDSNNKLSIFETHYIGQISRNPGVNKVARGDLIVISKKQKNRMPHTVIDSKFQSRRKFGGLQIKFNNQDEVILEGEFLEKYRTYSPEKNHKDIPYVFTPTILSHIQQNLQYVDIEFYKDMVIMMVPASQTKNEGSLNEVTSSFDELCNLLNERLVNKDLIDTENQLQASASTIYYPRIGSGISMQWALSRLLITAFIFLIALGFFGFINLSSNDLGFLGMFIWWLVLYVFYVKTPSKRRYL